MNRFRTTLMFAVVVVVGAVLGATAGSANELQAATRAGMSPMMSFSRSSIVNRSAFALDEQNWQKGVDLAQSALQNRMLNPGNFPVAYNNLCIGLTFLQQADEALDFCNKAVQGRPRQWEFYNNRAIAHYYLGSYDRSLIDYYMAMTFSRSETLLLENMHLTLKARKNADLRGGDSQA